jgi:CxxC motif-containing protein
MTRRIITCILCPNGCELDVEYSGQPSGETLVVEANLCPKGRTYALEELTRPKRTLTTSVLVRSGDQRLISVKTASPIPRQAMRGTIVTAPVSIGDTILRDVAGTGIDIVATRAVERKTPGG